MQSIRPYEATRQHGIVLQQRAENPRASSLWSQTSHAEGVVPKISEHLVGMQKQDLVLPQFQREFVWTNEQSKQLFVSLFHEYPIGALLFWKTDSPPALKNIEEQPEKLGTLEVILDGQQRLTTLYLLITGEVPPFYRERDIENDPRDLQFNIESGEFQYYQKSKMADNSRWISVTRCFTDSVNPIQIASTVTDGPEAAMEAAARFNENLTRLRNIQKIDLPVLTVPAEATLEDAIDIFDRVNDQGTKLTDAELALTHIVGKWPTARNVMKSKIRELQEKNFEFDLSFLTRALTGVVKRRALFETIHAEQKPELEEGWRTLSGILDYLVNFLPQRAFIHSTDDLNTTNVLIPLIVYLAESDGKFPSEKSARHATHWLYAAHTWSRYTAQTDQRLEHDVSLIVRHRQPWGKLRDQIIDQRGRIQVKAADFNGRGIRHPLYRTIYLLAKVRGAVDWFNGTPLGETHGSGYEIHNHHIFPRGLLYEERYDPDDHLDRKKVNEIANRAFLTAKTNWDLADEEPAIYLPEVAENYPGALKDQFIPMEPELWTLENYEEFLRARRGLMVSALNEFMDSLITEAEELEHQAIEEIIQRGESATLEFKSTLQWDVRKEEKAKYLRHEVLKTVAAFLNSEGGLLIVGVEDDGNVLGLDEDIRLAGGDLDALEQLLMNLFNEYIGPEFSPFIKARFENVDGRTVAAIEVDQASEPAFVRWRGEKQFFVRLGNTTRALDAEETLKFIQMGIVF